MSPDKARYVEMAAGITMVLHKLLLKRVFSVEKVSLDSLRESSEHRRKIREMEQAARDAKLSNEVFEMRLATGERGENFAQWTGRKIEEVGKNIFDTLETISPRTLVRQSINQAKLFGLDLDSRVFEDTAAMYLRLLKLGAEALYNVFAGFHISSTGGGHRAGGRGGAVASVFCGLAIGFLRAVILEITIRRKEKKDHSMAWLAGSLEELGYMAYEDAMPKFNHFWRLLFLFSTGGLSVAAGFALSGIVGQGNDPTSEIKVVDSVITRSLETVKKRLESDENLRIAQIQLQKRVNEHPTYPPNANVYQILGDLGLPEGARAALTPTIPEDIYSITTKPPGLKYNKELLARAFLWAQVGAARGGINGLVFSQENALSWTATGEVVSHATDERARRFCMSLGMDDMVLIEAKTKSAKFVEDTGGKAGYEASWAFNNCEIRSGTEKYSFRVAEDVTLKYWQRGQFEWVAGWMVAVNPGLVRCDLQNVDETLTVMSARFFCERLTESERRRLRVNLEKAIGSLGAMPHEHSQSNRQLNLLKHYRPGQPIHFRTAMVTLPNPLSELGGGPQFSVEQTTVAVLYRHPDGFLHIGLRRDIAILTMSFLLSQ
jgi:hypothetical protein